jgi:hypothetical protein
MASNRFILDITNDAIGAGNPAQVHFDFDTTSIGSTEDLAAACIAFVSGASAAAVNSRIVGVNYRASGAAGAIPVAFPVTEYASIVAANGFLTAMGAYAVAYGIGALAPAGSSETLSLYTALAGRAGTGRIYLPWVGSSFVTGTGGLDPAYVAGMEEAYLAMFLGTPGATWDNVSASLKPAVQSSTAGTHVITAVKGSAVIANLHSRRS